MKLFIFEKTLEHLQNDCTCRQYNTAKLKLVCKNLDKLQNFNVNEFRNMQILTKTRRDCRELLITDQNRVENV